METKTRPIEYTWTIFDDDGYYKSSGSRTGGRVSLDDVKKSCSEACWRKGYVGILVGVTVDGIACTWRYENKNGNGGHL